MLALMVKLREEITNGEVDYLNTPLCWAVVFRACSGFNFAFYLVAKVDYISSNGERVSSLCYLKLGIV